MSMNVLGINVNVSSVYEAVRKGGHKAPPGKPPLPPTGSNLNFFDCIKNFFGRSIYMIQNNFFVSVGAFATANLLFLAIAKKVNHLAKDHIAKFVHSENEQKIASYGLEGVVIFTGNYAFGKMIQYSLSYTALTLITVGVCASEILYKEGYQAFKSYQEAYRRRADQSNQGQTNEAPPLYTTPIVEDQTSTTPSIEDQPSTPSSLEDRLLNASSQTIEPPSIQNKDEQTKVSLQTSSKINSASSPAASQTIVAPSNSLTASTLNPDPIMDQLSNLKQDLENLKNG